MGPCSGFPVGLVHLVKPKVKAGPAQFPGWPCPCLPQPFLPNTEAVWSSPPWAFVLQHPPKCWPLQQFLPFLLPLCTVQPPPPSTLSSLLSPSYISWLQNSSPAWFLPLAVVSPPPLPLHLYIWFNCISVPWSSKMDRWGHRGAVTWLCSNLGFSLSLLLCLWLPLAVLPWFLTQMIN